MESDRIKTEKEINKSQNADSEFLKKVTKLKGLALISWLFPLCMSMFSSRAFRDRANSDVDAVWMQQGILALSCIVNLIGLIAGIYVLINAKKYRLEPSPIWQSRIGIFISVLPIIGLIIFFATRG